MGGNITAPSIGTISVRGNMNALRLTLQAPGQDLRSLSARKGIIASLINTSGDVGVISSRFMASTDVYAGIGGLANGKTIPDSVANLSAANFVTPASIGAVSLHPVGRTIGFTDSNIGASQVGNLNLGSTQTDNVGSPFGVAALSLAHFAAVDKTKKQLLVFNQLTTPAQSTSSGDLQINIL